MMIFIKFFSIPHPLAAGWLIQNPVAVFHLVGPAEIIGFIADNAENAGHMRAP
ncbi:MAG: hypothetical protein OET63_12945 [Desulfobacterales bacterium]|jgi:hypothetical protein|nr:hypothetical protein [Desulfobacterales bacterium]